MLRTTAVLLVGLFVSSLASAADNGIYLGAAVSQSRVDFDINSLSVDGNDTKYKLIAGIRPLDWLAVEVNYVDFGAVDSPTVKQELKGFDAFAVGLFEIAIVDLYAKVGLISWDQKIDFTSVASLDQSESGTNAAYGAGVQVHLGSLSLRGEYEKFDIGSNTNAELISIGLTWTFL
jgi:hypothetical protein